MTGRSSRIPMGIFTEQSASTRESLHFLYCVKPSLLAMERGIRLTLAPKSHRHLSKVNFPMAQGKVKLPGSSSFLGMVSLWIIALHS
ncbi:hypothetical protein YC2023_081912 [Brassica napus]